MVFSHALLHIAKNKKLSCEARIKMNFLDSTVNKISAGLIVLLMTLIMTVLLPGCAGKGNYGTMTFDRHLDDQFTSYQILPGHNYYITGGYSTPAAILAIQKDYQLANNAGLWVPVPDISTALMQNWIDNLSEDNNFWQERPFLAYYILNPEGKRVGAWYSAAHKTTTVEFLEGNRISVYVPHLTPSFGGETEEENSLKH
jgi:hypothetical protein